MNAVQIGALWKGEGNLAGDRAAEKREIVPFDLARQRTGLQSDTPGIRVHEYLEEVLVMVVDDRSVVARIPVSRPFHRLLLTSSRVWLGAGERRDALYRGNAGTRGSGRVAA